MNPEQLINSAYEESAAMLELNIITPQADLQWALKNKVPEGAMYFEGIVSDGEKNRNWYIIDPKAWFKNKRYVKDFLATGSILNAHDSEQPIGRPLTFKLLDDNKVHVSGYVFDDMYTNGAIGRGLILGLSTGHITHERMFMDEDSGTMYTEDDFWKLEWSVLSKMNWCVVVTDAEICEFSFVTVRSNRASVLVNEIATRLKKDPTEVERLFLNHNTMSNAEKTTETTVETNAAPGAKETTAATVETLSVDQITEQNKVLTDENAAHVATIEQLNTKIAEMETNHTSALETLKANLEKEYADKLVDETNKIRQDLKTELVNEFGAAVTNKVVGAPRTMKEFTQKHVKK